MHTKIHIISQHIYYYMLILNPFTGKIYQSIIQVSRQASFIPDKYHYQVQAKDKLVETRCSTEPSRKTLGNMICKTYIL